MNNTNANLPSPFLPLSYLDFGFPRCANPNTIVLAVNKLRPLLFSSFAALTLTLAPSVDAQISPAELVAPRLEISGGNLNFTVQPSVTGRSYQLQSSDTMDAGTWQNQGGVVIGTGSNLVISTPYVPSVARRFYRLAIVVAPAPPDGFSLIPAGEFLMGDQSVPSVGQSWEFPVHTVYVSAFYMAKHEVTKGLWDNVRTWANSNGYAFPVGPGKAANHPVHTIGWGQMALWCNARSEMENLTPCYDISLNCNWSADGYRLPTEAEWEKAARGGQVGRNFPWGSDTITHSQANYNASTSLSYDVSPTRGYHPDYDEGAYPWTSPVGSFAPNGYGLYDMTGNVWERCWDRYETYTSAPQSDPRGPSSGYDRISRGGSWAFSALSCRCSSRWYD